MFLAPRDTRSSSVSMTTSHAQTSEHKQCTPPLLLCGYSQCHMWHWHNDEVWCSAFNQRLAGWRSPLCVVEAEWWLLQTAACRLCSLGPTILWADGTATLIRSFSEAEKIGRMLCSKVSIYYHRCLWIYIFLSHFATELLCDILLPSDVKRALKLHFTVHFCIFHPLSPSRKGA